MRQRFLKSTMLVAMLAGIVWVAGCKVEKLPSREELKDQAESKKNADVNARTAVVVLPTPTNDDAALVIAACGAAASDQVVTADNKIDNGSVRRMVYNGRHEVTLDFIPLQTNGSAGNGQPTPVTAWRFNEASVENQKLLTADNIKVYLPCAASALAKEF